MSKFLRFLSIAKKAGKLIEGYNRLTESKNNQKIYLIIMSNDLSKSSKDKFIKICDEKKISYINDFSKYELATAIGCSEIKILGICDKNISEKLLKLYEEEKYMNKN